jgi:hypothetical protein
MLRKGEVMMKAAGIFLTLFIMCMLGIPAGIFTWLFIGMSGGLAFLAFLCVTWSIIFGLFFEWLTS